MAAINNRFDINKIKKSIPHGGKTSKLKKIPVKILFNNSRLCTTVRKIETTVIAKTAAEAANWVADKIYDVPEVEIYAYGPRGGEVYRHIGWESAIGHIVLYGHRQQHEIQQAINDLDPNHDNDWREA